MRKYISRTRASFDTARFYADLERILQERKATWYQLALATDARSFAAKANRRGNPRIGTLAAVASWAGLSLDAYILRREEK